MLTTTECLFCEEQVTSTRPSPAGRAQPIIYTQPSWWPALYATLQKAQAPARFIHSGTSSRTVVNLCVRDRDIALGCHLDCLLKNQELLQPILQAMSSSPPSYRESLSRVSAVPHMPADMLERYNNLCFRKQQRALIAWTDHVWALNIARKYIWPQYYLTTGLQQEIGEKWSNLCKKLQNLNSFMHYVYSSTISARVTDIFVLDTQNIWLGFESATTTGLFASIVSAFRSAPQALWQPIIEYSPAYTERPTEASQAPPTYSGGYNDSTNCDCQR